MGWMEERIERDRVEGKRNRVVWYGGMVTSGGADISSRIDYY